MRCTTDDFTLDEDNLNTFASCRTSCRMSGGSSADNDQFLLGVHVVEVTGTVVVVVVVVEVDVELVVVDVVVVPNVGTVVVGTLTALGQYLDG
jgi:hypothetical protein